MEQCRSSIRDLVIASRATLCCLAIVLLLAPTSSLAASILVESRGQTHWKYVDDGTEPPAEWTQIGFDDSKWKLGCAPLGYGERGLATQLSYGGDHAAKYLTSYFRRSFKVAPAHGLSQLVILLRVDDGAIVYLNGKEVIRENIAAGPTNSKTAAQRRIDGTGEGSYSRYLMPAALLVAGQNELAVEVHQCNAVSSDLFFDLLLKGYRDGEEPQPVKLNPAAREITLAYRTKHYVSGGQVIPDGYVDGGRTAEFAASGHVEADREVIVVDRMRDPELRKHLAFARSEFIANLPPLQRARFLALYVDVQSSPPEGRNVSFASLPLVEAEFRNRELLLGQSVGTGVCRHRALLFKVLGDEAGLCVGLARGNFGTTEKAAGHSWNELSLADGKNLIVDCMNPQGGFDFPETTADIAGQYLTVENDAYYPAK